MGGADEFRVGPDEDPDRYRLLRLHSSGAEGQVWRGSRVLESGLVLDVAIKILHPERSGLISEWRDRWTEQVELLRSLHYPGVVPVREAFEGPLMHTPGESVTDRSLYLVMNWIDGETLHEWVSRREQPDVFEALRLLTQVADALDYLHSGRVTDGKPVVHRDVKPANIIVSDDVAVLVDFGLVRALTKEAPLLPGIGTVAYMAPEVVTRGEYTPDSDRYALGCVAYYMLTREDPPEDNDLTKMRQKLSTVPALGANPSLLDHLMTMLDPDPAGRPARATTWVQFFRSSTLTSAGSGGGATRSNPPPSRTEDLPTAVVPPQDRRRSRLIPLVAALAALIAAVGAYALLSGEDKPNQLGTEAQGSPVTTVAAATTSTVAPTTSSTVAPVTTTTNRTTNTTTSGSAASTPAATGGAVPVPNPTADALRALLLTPTDLKPVTDYGPYQSTDVPFLRSPLTTVCESVTVPTRIVNPVSTAFGGYGSEPAGSMAVSMIDGAGFLQRMREAVAKCKLSPRTGPQLSDETFRYFEDRGSRGYDEHVYVRRGDVIVQVFIRTDSGLHSDWADQMAVIVADRMRYL